MVAYIRDLFRKNYPNALFVETEDAADIKIDVEIIEYGANIERNIAKTLFMPFGAGGRKCIGKTKYKVSITNKEGKTIFQEFFRESNSIFSRTPKKPLTESFQKATDDMFIYLRQF